MESEKKGWNSTLYNKQQRKKDRKQRRNDYESLLKTGPPENLLEEIIEQQINTKFQKIIDDEPKVERKETTQLEVKKAILKMKNNKFGDRSRWKAEWINKGGDEMIESL